MTRSASRWIAAVLVALGFSAQALAGPEEDALAALDAANAKVLGLSAVRSPSLTNIDTVKGELSALGPFFQTVASRLAAVPVDGSTRLLQLGGSVNAKIETAGQVSTVNIGMLIDLCRGLQADLDAWRAMLPEVRRQLQLRVDERTQALIREQVKQTFPTPVPPPPGPTATPVYWPTATPEPLPPVAGTPTPITLPPVDGGIIPGGPGPILPQPTAVPPGQPTPVPTPRPALRLPVPVAAGRNNQTVWVGNVQAGTVGVMDASTRRFSTQIPVGSGPLSMALDGGDQHLVVVNGGSNSVSLIDARANTVLKTIGVGAAPKQVLVTNNGKAYIACQDARRVDVIDIKRQLLVKSISLGSRPGHMDLPNSHQAIYVSLPDEDSLAVIDTGMDEVIATVAQ
jgi:YVTN family beta-propeller protein